MSLVLAFGCFLIVYKSGHLKIHQRVESLVLLILLSLSLSLPFPFFVSISTLDGEWLNVMGYDKIHVEALSLPEPQLLSCKALLNIVEFK